MNSKPTREATSPKTPRECSSQCLPENMGQQEDSQAVPPLYEDPSTLCESPIVEEEVIFRARSCGSNGFVGGSDSASGMVGGLILVSSYGWTPLGVGKGDSDGEVALLPRDCGRDESKELDEELVLSDGTGSLDGVLGLGGAAGSMMIGFAF